MMIKASDVKSTDPRKKDIMDKYKKMTNANKVTNVREFEYYFMADCWKHEGNRKFSLIHRNYIIDKR